MKLLFLDIWVNSFKYHLSGLDIRVVSGRFLAILGPLGLDGEKRKIGMNMTTFRPDGGATPRVKRRGGGMTRISGSVVNEYIIRRHAVTGVST